MTLDELKAEAKRQGYHLIPDGKREPLLPCVCGCNRRETWYGSGDKAYTLKCKVCGIEAAGARMRDARHNWNKMIRGLTDANG